LAVLALPCSAISVQALRGWISAAMPRSSIGRNTWRPPPDCSMSTAHTRNSAVWPMASSLPAGHVGAPGSVTTSDSGDEFGDHACTLRVGQGDRRHVRVERFEHDPFMLPATFTVVRRRLLALPALQRVAAASLGVLDLSELKEDNPAVPAALNGKSEHRIRAVCDARLHRLAAHRHHEHALPWVQRPWNLDPIKLAVLGRPVVQKVPGRSLETVQRQVAPIFVGLGRLHETQSGFGFGLGANPGAPPILDVSGFLNRVSYLRGAAVHAHEEGFARVRQTYVDGPGRRFDVDAADFVTVD